MEIRRDYEALTTRPVTDVVIPETEALEKLRAKFVDVATTNADKMIAKLIPDVPEYEEGLAYLEGMKQSVQEVGYCGMGFNEEILRSIYGDLSPLTYEALLTLVVYNVGNAVNKDVADPEGDNPAAGRIGMFLDLFRIISPEVATFDDGVKLFASVLRKEKFPVRPFILGAMLDDVINMRGTNEVPFDIFADTEGASLFAASYYNHATSLEQMDFLRGIDITFDELRAINEANQRNALRDIDL